MSEGELDTPFGRIVLPSGGPWRITHVGLYGRPDRCGDVRLRGDEGFACTRAKDHPGRHYRSFRAWWPVKP